MTMGYRIQNCIAITLKIVLQKLSHVHMYTMISRKITHTIPSLSTVDHGFKSLNILSILIEFHSTDTGRKFEMDVDIIQIIIVNIKLKMRGAYTQLVVRDIEEGY